MKNKIIKRIILVIMSLTSVISCAKSIDGVNNNNKYITNSIFIIDFDVKLYSHKESNDVIRKLKYFDPLIVLSEDVDNNDRIKVRLQDDDEGWVEEKYTSYISKDWIKKKFNEEYFCYALSNQNMKLFSRNKDNAWNSFEFKNKDYNIIYVLNYELDYTVISKQYDEGIRTCITAGDDKRLNWSKEFIFGNYKIKYVITTDDPDRWIIESFDFVKISEENLKKDHSFSTTYKRSEPLEKRLNQKKMLFSTLQSLK